MSGEGNIYQGVIVTDELTMRIQFLRESGIDEMGHSGQGLLNHLLGTRTLLEEWGARPALSDAGLFHSVYGTEVYKASTIPLSMRDSVRKAIGEEAETLAWLFGIMKRRTLRDNFEREADFRVQHRLTDEWLPINARQFSDLANLEVANALEQLPRFPEDRAVKPTSLLDFQPYIAPAAAEALERFFNKAEGR